MRDDRSAHRGKQDRRADGRGCGLMVGCALAVVIGAALLFAARFLYLHTPLGPALREMLSLPE